MKGSLAAVLLALALAATAAGCGPGFGLKTPDGFVELEDQKEYDYRATTAQGVVLAVRSEPNRPKGNLAFWTDAIDLKLRAMGYEAVEAKDVKTKSGATGKQLRYKRALYDRPHTFWLTVFVTPGDVYVIEAGGDTRDFDKAKDTILAAIEGFKPG